MFFFVLAWLAFAVLAVTILCFAEAITLFPNRRYANVAVRYGATFTIAFIAVVLYGHYVVGQSLGVSGLTINRRALTVFLQGAGLGTFLSTSVFLVMWVTGGITPQLVAIDRSILTWWIPLTLFLSFLQAGTEEILLRTVLLQQLVYAIGIDASCWLWGAAFGLVHLLNSRYTLPAILSTAFAGVILSYSFVQTNSVWTSVGIHGAWNFVIFQLLMSGRIIAVEIHPSLLRGGGSSNLEGSLVSVVVLGATALWITFT